MRDSVGDLYRSPRRNRPGSRSASRARRAAPTRNMRRIGVVAIIVVLIALLAITAIALPAGASTGRAQQALAGGGPTPPQEVFLPSGGSLDGLYPLVARNTSGSPLSVRVAESVPKGIIITPEVRSTSIPARQTITIPYALRLDTNLAPGSYRVEINVVPANTSVTAGSVEFIPAIAQRYTVIVRGEAGEIRARAKDMVEKANARGTFVVSRISGVSPVPVARAVGEEIVARVVPGDYEVALEIDGNRLASRQVRVQDGKTTEAQLEVALLRFTQIDAEQIDLDDRLAAMAFVVRFANSLRPLADAQVTLEVRRNSKVVETVEVQRFEQLATGVGTLSTRYIPRQGWINGAYEFRFRLRAGNVTIVAETQPTLQVGPAAKSASVNGALIAVGALVLLVLLGVAWWGFHRRRPTRHPRDPLAGRRIRHLGISNDALPSRSSEESPVG